MKHSSSSFAPTIANRRAMHDFFITAKLECGIVLEGSEVKSLRQGKASLQESYATIQGRQLILHGCHIDPYEKATLAWNHSPVRDRVLLAHWSEIRKMAAEIKQGGMTLVPLAIYFKGGHAKVELGLARGKKQHDKRATIKRKEQDREMRRATTHRQ